METKYCACGASLQEGQLFCGNCGRPADKSLNPDNIDNMSIGQLMALSFVLLITYCVVKPAFDKWMRGQGQQPPSSPTASQDGSTNAAPATDRDKEKQHRTPGVGPSTERHSQRPGSDPLKGEAEMRTWQPGLDGP